MPRCRLVSWLFSICRSTPIAGLPAAQVVLAGFAQQRRQHIGEHVMAGSSWCHGNVTLSPLNHQIFQKFLCYIYVAALGTSSYRNRWPAWPQSCFFAGNKKHSTRYLFLRYVSVRDVIAYLPARRNEFDNAFLGRSLIVDLAYVDCMHHLLRFLESIMSSPARDVSGICNQGI